MERGRGGQSQAPASAVPGAGMGSAPVGQPGLPGQALCVPLGMLPTPGPHTQPGPPLLPPAPPPPPPGRQSALLAAEWQPGTAGDTWAGGAGQAALLAVIKADEL